MMIKKYGLASSVLLGISGALSLAAPAGAQTASSTSVQQTNAAQIAELHQEVQTLKAQEAALPAHDNTNFQASPSTTKARLEYQINALQTKISRLQGQDAKRAKHNTEMLKQIGVND